jgi:hypothetical protein
MIESMAALNLCRRRVRPWFPLLLSEAEAGSLRVSSEGYNDCPSPYLFDNLVCSSSVQSAVFLQNVRSAASTVLPPISLPCTASRLHS